MKIKKLIDTILFTNEQPQMIIYNKNKYVYHKYEKDYFNYKTKTYLFRDEISFFEHLEEEVKIIKKENNI